MVIATSAYFRQKIEAIGIGYRAVRPDRPDTDADPDLMRRIIDARRGSEYVLRDLVMPVVRESYANTLVAAASADLMDLGSAEKGSVERSARSGVPAA